MTDQTLAPPLAGTIENAVEFLKARFPDTVTDDTRQGYSGVLVNKNQLVDVARTLRDELGFDYLSSATAVDYLGVSDHMEVVYHAYRTSGGSPLVFKAQT